MPRDSAGNYTLPLDDVEGNTLITADWANETMNDLAIAMTDSLDREGRGGMLVPLRFLSGGVGQPGMSWTEAFNTGFFLESSSDMRVSVTGIASMRWTSDGVDILVDGQFEPVLSGSLDADVVFYNNANQIIITGDEVQTGLDQLSLVLSGALEGIELKGTWDASTGDDPGDPVPPEGGDMWIVDIAGDTLLDAAGGGPQLGDWLVGQRPVYVASATPPGWVRLAAIDGIIASEVLFDSTVFDANLGQFPSPTQVQSALDFSWQYIANIVDGLDAINIDFSPSDGMISTNVQTAILEVRSDAPRLETTNNFTEINQFTVVPSSLAGPLLSTDLTNLEYVNALDDRITDNEGDIEQLQSDIGNITASGTDFDDINAPPTEYLNVQTGLTAALDAGGTRFDPTGLIPEENVEDAINFIADFVAGVVGGLEFRGDWDASDGNPPDFGEQAATGGDFWLVSVAGGTLLPSFPNEVVDLGPWNQGDRAIYLDNVNGTGYILLVAATSLPASSITFNSFNFDNAFPQLPSPDDVQEALDIIWAPLANVVDGGIIISPTPLLSIDLNTLGDPDDAGWYLQESTPGGGLNYPEIASGMLQVVASALAGVTQVYYASGGVSEGGTIYHRLSLANGGQWSDWDTGLDQSALDEHAALIDATAPLSHLTNATQTIGGLKTFQINPTSLAVQDATDNALVKIVTLNSAITGLQDQVDDLDGDIGDIGGQLSGKMNVAGGTFTGLVTFNETAIFIGAAGTDFVPTQASHLTRKGYVDSVPVSPSQVTAGQFATGVNVFPVIAASNETVPIVVRAGSGAMATTGAVATINGSTGQIATTGNLVAFAGQLAINQPHINASGLTTSFDLIEHLLDKIEEMETKLANAGIAGF